MKLEQKRYEFQTEKGSKVEVEIKAKIKDLDKADLEEILHEYASRTRNFYLSLGRKICKETMCTYMEKPDYEFSDSDFSFPENPDQAIAEKILWAFEQDEETGFVTVVPTNAEMIVVHGKQEAEMFCNTLIKCFQ